MCRRCRNRPALAPPQSQLTPRARAPRVDDPTENSPAREASPSLSLPNRVSEERPRRRRRMLDWARRWAKRDYFGLKSIPTSPNSNGNLGQDLGKIRAKPKNCTFEDSFAKQALTPGLGGKRAAVAAFTPRCARWPRTSRAAGGGRSPGRGRQVPPARWRSPPRSKRSRLPGRGGRRRAARSRSDR